MAASDKNASVNPPTNTTLFALGVTRFTPRGDNGKMSTAAAPPPSPSGSSGLGLPWASTTFFEQLSQEGQTSSFGTKLDTQALPDPHRVVHSAALAQDLGLSRWVDDKVGLATLAGHRAHGQPVPFASVYSGHQFGAWAGQLGDGRAHLLGTLNTAVGALELQLKGCGLTPYSRMGDGRAVLRSSIREFLASEAMHALGIPTTRALAVIGSSLPVRRETMETAAVVARVAPSFLRFGHFEHFTHTARDVAALKALTDAAIAAYFPAIPHDDNRYVALLQTVTQRTANLIADWQAVGFCHGVMNTDNMSLLGLTIDYGPFGFLDAYVPGHICNHSDHEGRYAFARQPGVGLWNLSALAHGLMPLLPDMDAVKAILQGYPTLFEDAMLNRMRNKLGLHRPQDSDLQLINDWLRLLANDRVDFTLAHRRLAAHGDTLRDLFLDRAALDAWLLRYQNSRGGNPATAEAMNRVNPKYILRNHLAQRAIEQAQAGDFSETQQLLAVLQKPFDDQPEHDAYAQLPPDWAQHLEISCSS